GSVAALGIFRPRAADMVSRRAGRVNSYVPLWCKSNGSFLEGASHPEELMEETHRLGLGAMALTDRDGVYGIVRAWEKAREVGCSLIIGAELTVEESTIVLLAQT